MRPPVPTDGYLCGWRIRSDLALPELAAWNGDNRPPDIHVRFGAVPDRLERAVATSPLVQIDPRGQFLLKLADVGAFHVKGPGEVVIAPAAGTAEAELRLFLLGSVLGFLCHLRGLFPLHASSVAIAGKAVAFCGPSGAGKSTTALHMSRRGYPLLADDVTVLDIAGGMTVLPAFPRLKLWQDSLASLAIDSTGLEQNRRGQQKFHYRLSNFQACPTPLAAIFLLSRSTQDAKTGMVRLKGPLQIIPELRRETFRVAAAEAAGLHARLLATHAVIAASVPIYRLSRPFDMDGIGKWLDEVEDMVGG